MKIVNSLTIGLAGLPFSGKSELTRYLAERHHARVWSGGLAIRTILESMHRLPQPYSRSDYSALSMVLRQVLGDEYIFQAFATARGNLPQPPQIAVHDGIRWPGTALAHAREPNFRLIYLTSSPEVRFLRACQSGSKNGRPAITTIEEFLAEEQLPSELQTTELKKYADLVLDTSQPLEVTQRELDRWILTPFPAP